VSNLGLALSWRPLGESDLPAVAELAAACLAADGGQPFAASPDFLRQWYLAGAQSYAGFDGTKLIGAASLRQPQRDSPGGAPAGAAVTTGLVHPDWRRRGIGGQAFDWASDRAGRDGIRAETEALGDGAHALYLSRGLSQVLAEDVMQLAASAGLPPAQPPAGLALSRWGQADPARFHAVYESAFRDRPGFPGWPQARWIEWITDDEDFRTELALLATLEGTDVAFIVGDAAGWIVKLGVVPHARGQGLGAHLMTEVVHRIRTAGEMSITLDVDVDNPRAVALYRRLGFTRIGCRAKYEAQGQGHSQR
jgi:mycothiol synthase